MNTRIRLAKERKFLLSAEQGRQVLDWAGHHLRHDPHADADGSYAVRSIYFDTEDFAILRKAGSYARSKYRLRRYGEEERVFLERKLSRNGVLAKRRTSVDGGELLAMVLDLPSAEWRGSWFQRRVRLRALWPACEVMYRRFAFLGDQGLRLTLDGGLFAAPAFTYLFDRTPPSLPFAEGRMILEVKSGGALPVICKRLVGELGLQPAGFSKYRQAVAALGLATPGHACLPA